MSCIGVLHPGASYYEGPWEVGVVATICRAVLYNAGDTSGILNFKVYLNPNTGYETQIEEGYFPNEIPPEEYESFYIGWYVPDEFPYDTAILGLKAWCQNENEPEWGDTAGGYDKTHIWEAVVEGVGEVDICDWLQCKFDGPNGLDLTDVFQAIDAFLYEMPPPADCGTQWPHVYFDIQDIMGVIDYYLGFFDSGNQKTGCSF